MINPGDEVPPDSCITALEEVCSGALVLQREPSPIATFVHVPSAKTIQVVE